MDVRREKNRVRSASVFTTHGKVNASLKGGDLVLKNLNASVEVAPDGVADFEFTVQNRADSVPSNDPDHCGSDGFEYAVSITPSTTSSPSGEFFETGCIEAGETRDHSASFNGPGEPEDTVFFIELEARSSGATDQEATLVIFCDGCPTSPGPGQCLIDEDCPSDNCQDSGQCTPLFPHDDDDNGSDPPPEPDPGISPVTILLAVVAAGLLYSLR